MERYGKEVIWTFVKFRCSLMDAMTETENPEGLAAHTCVDFPRDFCAACGREKQDPDLPPKENPPCYIPVLRADKGGK